MSTRPSSLRSWLRRYSLTLVAAVGGAAGVAYAAARDTSPPAAVPTPTTPAVATTHTGATAAPVPAELPRDTVQDTVQVAILLDTSSSMNGLINQARSHMWSMVDEMGKATRVVDGKLRTVKVELALYEYGHSLVPAKDGYIRQVIGLTSDLDRVSEELHRLSTNGGEEFAGQAILTAVDALPWSDDPAALKFIVLAGNEGFDQGPITAKAAMDAARAKDISVQLIHCGPSEPTWTAAAKLAQTDLMTIDQNHVARHIPAPQDDEILRLGAELNRTYLAYGAEGGAALNRQVHADAASAALSPKVAIERAQLKRKASYRNDHWDVVDAVDKDGKFLARAADGDLPTELRGKSLEEKQRIVDGMAAERAQLKAKIARLEAERKAFLAVEEAKQAEPAVNSLGSEMMKSTRKEATKKGYKF
jgi:hypothetical protein